MLSIAEAMGERHGVVIHYDPDELAPQLVDRIAHLFGKISSSSTFSLHVGGVLSVFLFAEPSAATRCYETLRVLVDAGEVRIANVGWINEDDIAKLVEKSYVRARWRPASVADKDNGFLLVLTKSLQGSDSGVALTRLTRSLALEVHEDDKEGGRLFMRCADEDSADEARREIIARFPQLRYAVSFADQADFDLVMRAAQFTARATGV